MHNGENDSILVLNISGMSCAGCVRSVEKTVQSDPAVRRVNVDLLGGSVQVEWEGTEPPSQVTERLISTLGQKGYTASVPESRATTNTQEEKQGIMQQLPVVAILLTLPLVMQMALPLFGFAVGVPPLIQLIMVIPVQFWWGVGFYRGLWTFLKTGTATMDTLVAIGTTAAFGLSLYLMIEKILSLGLSALWSPRQAHDLYFETAAVIITLVLVSKIMEARARRETDQAVQALVALRPTRARVRRDGQVLELDSAALRPGDQVIVAAGEGIPCDGEVIRGESEVDESLVTGEFVPVPRGVGDRVIGGALNCQAVLEFKATALGADSFLSGIIAQVRDAQQSKAPIQKMVDRVSAVFVPAVLAVSVLTFFGWWVVEGQALRGLLPAISVLVIACPCALGLATPTALRVGVGMAARYGVLFRDAAVIEALPRVSHVAFDKTGTLTEGRPVVVRHWKKEKAESHPFWPAFINALADSKHPLSAAVREFEDRIDALAPPVQVMEKAGSGLEIKIDDIGLIRVGSAAMIADSGLVLAAEQDWATEMTAVVVLFLPEGEGNFRLVALYGFEDAVRAEASESLSKLYDLGLKSLLLSGDCENAVEGLATRLGLSDFYAGQKPAQKLSVIRALQAEGKKVAMVGDGINDAPALAAADIGIAVGGGTETAIRSASVTLLSDRISQVVPVFKAGRIICAKIRHNLFGAFLYNCLGIPLAAFGALSPTLAGAAMAFSSVTVVVSSLFLYPALRKCFNQDSA